MPHMLLKKLLSAFRDYHITFPDLTHFIKNEIQEQPWLSKQATMDNALAITAS